MVKMQLPACLQSRKDNRSPLKAMLAVALLTTVSFSQSRLWKPFFYYLFIYLFIAMTSSEIEMRSWIDSLLLPSRMVWGGVLAFPIRFLKSM